MINFNLSYQWIRWRKPDGPPPALPKGVERLFMHTAGGPIEILHAAPTGPAANQRSAAPPPPPVFFVHGGMGSAWVWLEYMQYLSSRGVPCYAISLRGHGESWHPSFLRMVYGTPRSALADDLVAGIRFAEGREGGAQVVLCGHSSGGGLSQFVLSERGVGVRGLVLMGAVPGFGSMKVYINWWLLDPWFSLRMLFHGWHPNSPLSHPALTRRAFFSDAVPDSYVARFQTHINAYESFLWPLSMMVPFANAATIVRRVAGWGQGGGHRILVLAGGRDRLMTMDVMEKLAGFYRQALRSLLRDKKLDGVDGPVGGSENRGNASGREGIDSDADGVRLAVVPSAGHHMQNDVDWEVGAEKLLAFYGQL
ncbi:hypothetical protein KVR01_000667 [Diaporthe batatas]|uniref:uncharacterized protein n=1 Tax=Diaporthe batatas TaxID=748121 RepID=UPI001D03B752|nr:uncharacterized protein KVR01_000667 [Diaporthe batatas]KAG8169922.1 hypothetical protein KVR01_000667 [Diaporthe batatas]